MPSSFLELQSLLGELKIAYIYRRGMGEKASGLKNLCPEREDYQEVPRKVKQIMKNQHKLKSLNRKKEKKKFKNQRRLGNWHVCCCCILLLISSICSMDFFLF